RRISRLQKPQTQASALLGGRRSTRWGLIDRHARRLPLGGHPMPRATHAVISGRKMCASGSEVLLSLGRWDRLGPVWYEDHLPGLDARRREPASSGNVFARYSAARGNLIQRLAGLDTIQPARLRRDGQHLSDAQYIGIAHAACLRNAFGGN